MVFFFPLKEVYSKYQVFLTEFLKLQHKVKVSTTLLRWFLVVASYKSKSLTVILKFASFDKISELMTIYKNVLKITFLSPCQTYRSLYSWVIIGYHLKSDFHWIAHS